MKIVHKRGKPLKSGEKTIVLNVSNKFKRIYKVMFKQIRFPYTSKRTRHRSVVAVLGRCMCHKHFAPMAEGYTTQFLFKLANQRLAKAHAFVDIRIVVPLNFGIETSEVFNANDHRCGLRVTSLPLTQRARVRSLIGSISKLCLPAQA